MALSHRKGSDCRCSADDARLGARGHSQGARSLVAWGKNAWGKGHILKFDNSFLSQSLIATLGHVITSARNLDPQSSSHGPPRYPSSPNVNVLDLTLLTPPV